MLKESKNQNINLKKHSPLWLCFLTFIGLNFIGIFMEPIRHEAAYFMVLFLVTLFPFLICFDIYLYGKRKNTPNPKTYGVTGAEKDDKQITLTEVKSKEERIPSRSSIFYCELCGSELSAGEKYCTYCGAEQKR